MLKTALVAGTLLALYLLFLLRHLVLILFLAIAFASALRPLVSAVQRRLHLPRGVAVLALNALALLGVAASLAVAVPSFVNSAVGLLNHSHDVYGRWYELAAGLRDGVRARLNIPLPALPPQEQVEAWLAGLASDAGRSAPGLAVKAGALLGQVLLGAVMAYYWLDARDDLLGLALRRLRGEQQARFLAVFDEIEQVLGAYLGGQVILSALITVACLLAFWALGLPHAQVLAFVAGLLHMVPLVGALVGIVPAILVAMAISPLTGLLTAAIVVLIHQVENNFVAPRVLQRQMGLNPLLIIVALTAGAILGGAAGALVAIPVAGAASILARHFLWRPSLNRRPAEQQTATAREEREE